MSEDSPYYRADLSGYDFTKVDLSGQNLSHSLLNGCRFGRCVATNFACCKGQDIDFRGAEITDTFFEQADRSVIECLPGAFWHGIEITHVSDWITSLGLYWCFATNAFVQIGCMQKTLDEWKAIGQNLETLSVLHEAQAISIVEILGASSMEAGTSASATNTCPARTSTDAGDLAVIAGALASFLVDLTIAPPSGYTLATKNDKSNAVGFYTSNANTILATKSSVGSGSISPGAFSCTTSSGHGTLDQVATLLFKP